MKKILFITFFLSFSCLLIANQQYNPFENRWETVPSDWQTQYNPFENTWSYQPYNAQIEYNPFEGSWDWDSGHNFYNQNTNMNTGFYL